jgi:hypothetical protein
MLDGRQATVREYLGKTPIMGPMDAFWHLLNFALPAFGVGLLSTAGAKLLWRRELSGKPWRGLARDTSLAALAVLVAGLVGFGQDGRMATYGAMVTVCALMLWWRGFRPARR